jgi:DNA-binding transcriptional LysR family regulator
LLAANAAIVEAQRAQRGEIGNLAVGFFEQSAYTFLPPVLRAFQERFPMVQVQLRWFPVVEQVEALMRGHIDPPASFSATEGLRRDVAADRAAEVSRSKVQFGFLTKFNSDSCRRQTIEIWHALTA